MQSESGNHHRRPRWPAHPPSTAPENDNHLQCPRCNSTHTKFCYYNNYNLSQPRHFCKTCRRYWTHGGSLRDIPSRRDVPKRSRSRSRSRSLSSPPTPPLLAPLPPRVEPQADLDVGACGSFTALLNLHESTPSGLQYDFRSDVEEFGSGAGAEKAWQIGINEGSQLVDGSYFIWQDLTAPADHGDNLKELIFRKP